MEGGGHPNSDRTRPSPAPPDVDARRVMVVDDDDDFREAVTLALVAQGYDVETATDGQEALERLAGGSHPAVILLDMMMPRLDGEGFMRAMRRDPRASDIPVVLLSGHHAAGQLAQELGAAACLVKPVELARLEAMVHEAAHAHRPQSLP